MLVARRVWPPVEWIRRLGLERSMSLEQIQAVEPWVAARSDPAEAVLPDHELPA